MDIPERYKAGLKKFTDDFIRENPGAMLRGITCEIDRDSIRIDEYGNCPIDYVFEVVFDERRTFQINKEQAKSLGLTPFIEYDEDTDCSYLVWPPEVEQTVEHVYIILSHNIDKGYKGAIPEVNRVWK